MNDPKSKRERAEAIAERMAKTFADVEARIGGLRRDAEELLAMLQPPKPEPEPEQTELAPDEG